jgi:hypothetical protein
MNDRYTHFTKETFRQAYRIYRRAAKGFDLDAEAELKAYAPELVAILQEVYLHEVRETFHDHLGLARRELSQRLAWLRMIRKERARMSGCL